MAIIDKNTIGSIRRVEWKRLFLAVSLAYPLALIPVGVTAYSEMALEDQHSSFLVVALSRSELYLTFSILAFSGIASALSNSDKVDGPVVVGSVFSLLLGVGCLFVASNMTDSSIPGSELEATVVWWSQAILGLSFVTFVICNLRVQPLGGDLGRDGSDVD